MPIVRSAAVGVTDRAAHARFAGQHRGLRCATVYARATGYIATRNVDIGSKVKAGDVLAVIAAPDLDQQLVQARAQSSQMRGGHRSGPRQYATGPGHKSADGRQLVVQGWQTKQQGDTDRLTYQAQTAALQVAEANFKAQQAQVSRLEELTGFEKVVAPFDGVITQRHIDVGSLVTADSIERHGLCSTLPIATCCAFRSTCRRMRSSA